MPDGKARRSDKGGRDIQWASRANGHPDGCPTEGGRAPDKGGQVPDRGEEVPDRGGQVPDRGRDGCPTESGSSPMEGAMGARRRVGSGGVAQRRVSGVAQRGTI
jgi:hypothetical protein